jgi:uncharacterized protein
MWLPLSGVALRAAPSYDKLLSYSLGFLLRRRIAVFISIVQSILFLAHWIIYATWVDFWFGHGSHAPSWIAWAFFLLSLSFVSASVLGFRFSGPIVRTVYTLAALWLGFVDFLVLGAGACWLIWGVTHLAGGAIHPHALATVCFGGGIAAGVYGFANAAATRVKRVSLRLPNLPDEWRGRTAVVASDLHLGHVRAAGFARRIARLINSLKPDIIFIAGDVFDGTAGEVAKFVAPLKDLAAPFGSYFVTGNHEEFGDPSRFIRAIQSTGIRVLENEKICVDGLQIVGVNYRTSVHSPAYETALAEAHIDRSVASIALVHAPDNLPVAQKAGISLQISGHTHRGQMFPFTWFAKHFYKQFVYGVHKLQDMFVLTSCGAGTWGPPMRVGTNPEIVLIELE